MSSIGKIRQNFPLNPSDSYISITSLNSIISSTTVKKAVIEETGSELWYETLHGPGKITFKNNIIYEGNLKFGILHNEDPENPSTLYFPDGTKYIGTVKNNRITGEGTYIFSNGDTYTGKVVNGLREGYGVFKSNKNILYEGEWKNGLKQGKGKIIQGNMELEGTWDKGILSGKCRIKWKTGNIFEGELKNNGMNGNGYMIWYNKKEKYIGQWKNNLQNGYGIHIYYSDDNNNENKFFRNRYIGQYKDGKRNGYGKMFYNNGCIYEGYWKNNKKEGFGIYQYFDKSKYIGNFKKDIMLDLLTKEQINTLLNSNNNNPNLENDNIVQKQSKGAIKSNALGKAILNKQINIKKSEEKAEKKMSKKERIIKNIEEIKVPLYLSDIMNIEQDVKIYLKSIDNILLRNLSLITHIYLVACGKEDIKSSDIGMSTVISDGKSMFKQSTAKMNQNNHEQKKINFEEYHENEAQNEEKKEIDYDNIYNNDLAFCLTFKDLWKLIRDCGLISPEINLAKINRIIFQNIDNYIDMFYIPIFFENNNKNRELFDNIYDYLFQKISKSKNDFDNKYQEKINKFAKLDNIEYEKEELYKSNNIFKNDFNYHEEKNIILLRYFYEILIRIAYIKYPEENFENRVKLLFETLKTYFRAKRKTGSDLTVMMIGFLDPKIKNPIQTLNNFINNNYLTLEKIFNEIYLYSCNRETNIKTYDKTITYRYFYDNIILNSESLKKIFENKMLYIDLITLFFKERKITSMNIDILDIPKTDIFIYIENLLDTEMIFYEFCELIFFICRKYFQFHNIVLLEEEEPKRQNDNKKAKKKTKRFKKDDDDKEATDNVSNMTNKMKSSKNIILEEKPKSEDYYLKVINEIIIAKDKFIKNNKYQGNNKYFYPILKTHSIIESLKEEERLKKIEEERKAKDRARYNIERNCLKEEDINVYKEINEENLESEEIADY